MEFDVKYSIEMIEIRILWCNVPNNISNAFAASNFHFLTGVKRNLNFRFSYSMCTMTSLNVFGKMVYSGLLCRCSNISVCIFDLLLLLLFSFFYICNGIFQWCSRAKLNDEPIMQFMTMSLLLVLKSSSLWCWCRHNIKRKQI